jgi:hypothetical protein
MFSCGVWLKQRLVPRRAGDLQVLPDSCVWVHAVNMEAPEYRDRGNKGNEFCPVRVAVHGKAELACALAHVS